MTTYTHQNIHHESALEKHIVDCLVKEQGYLKRAPENYERTLAMDTELVIRFIKEAQPDEWKKIENQYLGNAEITFLKRLEEEIKSRGMLDVLRNGLKMIPNIQFSLCFLQPASNLNPRLTDFFQANILSVMQQVCYSRKNERAIDIVLFVNGIPVATMELKNLPTDTSFKNAEKQYKSDRPPAGEPLLTFKRGALVHFALDEDNVSMTTRLMNGKTRFLPFNRGRNGGAGNPDIPNEFRIAYLYKDQREGSAVLGREKWLNIIGNFIHLEKSDKKESMLFPRFQQLDAVTKLIDHARTNGTGQNYLIQHSAGSGKSNTIGWVAHRLINLHDDNNKPIFNTVIIVTDRVVLDRQLQNTVSQLEHTKGIVKKIDGTSKDLKKAIESGERIIISTIQKFKTDYLQEVTGQRSRKFAILVDEAHSSQSGKNAQAIAEALTREESFARDLKDIEEKIVGYQKSRGPQANMSYFAFTATPRNVTLERFGAKGTDGLPHPFHLYSMRQAIEEGFILDVLQNYTTYEAYYKLEKAIEDNPKFKSRKAQRRVARFASLHPTAIDQKVEVIVEHFRRHVQKKIDGQGKAMVVTQSREHAVRYFQRIREYLENNKYNDIQALVAFSGELPVDGEKWTEMAANGFSEGELPRRFDGDEYQILIVAEKYQTGFDQPKLCTMYVDKKMSGLQCVQTLSRLNRTMHGKKYTYVLDFQNKIDDIQEAFKPYHEATSLEALSDVNQIYTLEQRLRKFGIIDSQEVDRFAETFYRERLTTDDRIHLERLVREAVQRFNFEDDEGKQEEFRQLLRSFMRFYIFVAQVTSLEDTGLEKLYSYSSWLERLLPNREIPHEIEVTEEMLEMQASRLEEKESGNASLPAGETGTLPPIDDFGANPYTEEEERSLTEIVNSFNERHGTDFTKQDFLRFEQVNQEIMSDKMTQMLRNNPVDVVYPEFKEEFFNGASRMFEREDNMRHIFLEDELTRDEAIMHFFKRALRLIKSNDYQRNE